jgi:hypothetical protein
VGKVADRFVKEGARLRQLPLTNVDPGQAVVLLVFDVRVDTDGLLEALLGPLQFIVCEFFMEFVLILVFLSVVVF